MAKDINIDIGGSTQSFPQWATEETLQQVATQLGSRASGFGKAGTDAGKAAKEMAKLAKTSKKIEGILTETAAAAGSVAQSFMNTDGSLNSLLPAFEGFVVMLNKGAQGLLSLGHGIPILEGFVKAAGVAADMVAQASIAMFDLATSVADALAEGFRDAAQVGATLEGNFRQLAILTTKANMGLEDLGPILERAGPTLAAFATSSDGARRTLAVLGKLNTNVMLPTFTRLGFTVAELNETAVDYLNILAMTGQTSMLRNASETTLANASEKYAVNMAVLSRLTGQSRKELQQTMMEESKRANVQALLALKEQDMSAEELEAFRNMQVGLKNFSPVLAEAFASITTMGVAVGTGQEAILAQLGPAGDVIKEFALKFKEGTSEVGDADVIGVLDAVAKGLTKDNTLQLALLAPAGGFPAALAEVVGEGLFFAQKFIAGDVSLAEIRKQVELERQGRLEFGDTNNQLIKSIIDAQTNVSMLSKDLQEAVITNEKFQKIIGLTTDAITGITNLLNKFLGFTEKEAKTAIDKYEVKDAMINATGNTYIYTDKGIKEVTLDEATSAIKSGEGTLAAWSGSNMKDHWLSENLVNTAKRLDPGLLDSFNTAKGEFKTNKDLQSWLEAQGLDPIKFMNKFTLSFQKGTKGIMDFGGGALAMLHGKEAVIPAPEGMIPVDLGDSLSPLVEQLNTIFNQTGGGNNLLAQDGVNSVQSKQVISKLDEMIGVLKYIAGGDPKVAQLSTELKRIASRMTPGVDLYRA